VLVGRQVAAHASLPKLSTIGVSRLAAPASHASFEVCALSAVAGLPSTLQLMMDQWGSG
jgi:hypothetical protein